MYRLFLFPFLDSELVADLSSPDVEGIYETQVPLDIRGVIKLGCVCRVHRNVARALSGRVMLHFNIQFPVS